MTSILLVEDHELLGKILAEFLCQTGEFTECLVARSAEEALERLPDLEIDLVLVDVSLPGMNGIELVSALLVESPDLSCMMLSGYVEPNLVCQSLAAGARGYVSKDNPWELIEGIHRVLDGEIYLSSDLETWRPGVHNTLCPPCVRRIGHD